MAPPTGRTLTGVVVSVGKMMKTVKVRIPNQDWNKHIRKYFPAPYNLLVRDPNSSTREGDIVDIQPGYRVSKQVKHVISRIVTPFGTPLDQRPSVPTAEQREKDLTLKRMHKDVRQSERGRLVSAQRLNKYYKSAREVAGEVEKGKNVNEVEIKKLNLSENAP